MIVSLTKATHIMTKRKRGGSGVRRVVMAALQVVVLWAVSSSSGIHISFCLEVSSPHEPQRCLVVAVPAP